MINHWDATLLIEVQVTNLFTFQVSQLTSSPILVSSNLTQDKLCATSPILNSLAPVLQHYLFIYLLLKLMQFLGHLKKGNIKI